MGTFQKFLIIKVSPKASHLPNQSMPKSALYAQECQFSIVGLVTGSVMNIINISVA